MNRKFRRWLEKNGLATDASVREAWEFADILEEQGVKYEGETGNRSEANGSQAGSGGIESGGVGSGVGSRSEVFGPEIREQVEGMVRDAIATIDNERATVNNAIAERVQQAGLSNHENGQFLVRLQSDRSMTIERAGELIIEALVNQRNDNISVYSSSAVSIGHEANEKFRSAVLDGICVRAGVRVENPAPGHNEFRGRTLAEIARMCLERAGESTVGLDNFEVAGRALVPTSTSDFSSIFLDATNRRLMQSYNEWPRTWTPFVDVIEANDFKAIHSIKISEAPDFEEMDENGEYKTAAFSDGKETYNLITKGVIFRMTRTMVVDDNLKAFIRVPGFFAAAAARMESDAVYALITGNPTMGDGVVLFHADHGNLEAGDAGPLTTTRLSLGRAAMRKQTGMNGASIDVTPAFLLTPVAQETNAEVILRSTALPDDNKSAGVHNPWAGKLTPIADPRLDVVSELAWYLIASPSQVPTIEAAYLAGYRTPWVESRMNFKNDALEIKGRHDFGAGVQDHPGFFKNPGA